MRNDLVETIQKLIDEGEKYKARAGDLFGIKRGDLRTDEYLCWKQLSIDAISKLGTSGDILRKDIVDYPNIDFSYEDSVERVLGNLKAGVGIARQANLKDFAVTQKEATNNVFIIHGHDEGAKEEVARFIEKIGLKPIILHERPNKGRTLIEKILVHSETVGFAIALLTPDDIGYSEKAPKIKEHRARQNVIFELGLFIGILGRSKVAVLYKEGVEKPSDYDGVGYILFDSRGGWRIDLAKELMEVFPFIDLNDLR